MLIAIEGVDGGGKSSLISMLEKYLINKSKNVKITREPGGTPLAEALRDALLDDYESEVVYKQTELLVMLAARLQHCKNVIEPHIDAGGVMITDRFEASTSVYQCGGVESMSKLYEDTKKAIGLTTKADITFVLDISFEVFRERMGNRNLTNRLDPTSEAIFNKIRDGYRDFANSDDQAIIIDASGTEQETYQAAIEALEKLITKSR
ncbi:dTMP kinase [Vibrio splendidus]|nr:dTMP kinase [Vibrio splendidus]MCC4881494.1 dTMP kinase [Vibrio splendidus]